MKKSMSLILCLLMALTVITGCESENKKATIVPEFTGHDVSEVYDWCAEIDEKYACEVSYVMGNGVERDKVMEQSVKGGSRLESDISFSISNGESPEIAVLYVIDTTEKSDVEAWKEENGLTNLSYVEEVSDTVKKNFVIRIEPETGITKDTPVTVYISSGKEEKKPDPEPENTEIEIEFGDYIGLTVEEFEAKAKALGLKPNHNKDRDRFDANVKIGNISWHGSGTYVKDEVFNYGVCINEIVVTAGAYVAKTEDWFISNAKKLTLVPTHIKGRDAYSSWIDKGDIVTHGSGVYVQGEEFKYGLSLGPAKVKAGYEGASEEVFLNYLASMGLVGKKGTVHSDTIKAGRIVNYNTGNYSTGDKVAYGVSVGPEIKVNVPDFRGDSEDAFLKYLKNNNLKAGKRATEESSNIKKGYIIRNDTGTKTEGTKINYVVSSGPAVAKAKLDSIDDIKTMFSDTELGFLSAYNRVDTYLSNLGFTNYEIIPSSSKKSKEGQIMSVTVDGEKHSKAKSYKVNAKIVVKICAEYTGS